MMSHQNQKNSPDEGDAPRPLQKQLQPLIVRRRPKRFSFDLQKPEPGADRETELGKIFSVARRKNTAQGITGALLLYEDWFAQTLEGEEGEVRKLFAVIENDSRHNAVEVREQGAVDARVFACWSMWPRSANMANPIFR